VGCEFASREDGGDFQIVNFLISDFNPGLFFSNRESAIIKSAILKGIISLGEIQKFASVDF